MISYLSLSASVPLHQITQHQNINKTIQFIIQHGCKVTLSRS